MILRPPRPTRTDTLCPDTTPFRSLIGDARVSTEEQDTAAQQDALRAQGCSMIFEDKASGAKRERPNLARALDRVGKDDTLLVVRIDRLARSLSHLLEIVEKIGRAHV